MWFRRRRPAFERPAPPGEVTLQAVGYVRNEVAKPRPRGWEHVVSAIEFLPEHEPRLAGIEAYSHVIVVFFADMAVAAPDKPETLTLASGRTYGIFATRSQLRPNHLGVSVVRVDRGRRGDGAGGRAGRDRRHAGSRYQAVPAGVRRHPGRHHPEREADLVHDPREGAGGGLQAFRLFYRVWRRGGEGTQFVGKLAQRLGATCPEIRQRLARPGAAPARHHAA